MKKSKSFAILIFIFVLCFVFSILLICGSIWGFFSDQSKSVKIVSNGTKLNSCYLKYEGSIYKYTVAEFYAVHKLDVNPEEFKVFDQQLCLGADKSHVISGWDKILPEADPNNFELISSKFSYYGKDNIHVYRADEIIENADPKTFKLLVNENFSLDKNNVYYLGKKVEGANPETFSIVENTQSDQTNYAKDSKGYFFRNKRIATQGVLKVISGINNIATDNKNVFWEGEILNGLTSNVKFIEDTNFLSDGNTIYLITNRPQKIEGVNVKNFKRYGNLKLKEGRIEEICGDGERFLDCGTGGKIEKSQIDFSWKPSM